MTKYSINNIINWKKKKRMNRYDALDREYVMSFMTSN